MDFFQIKERLSKSGTIEVYPDFKVTRSYDLMIRGKSFYAIWDPEKGLWSTDEYDVQRLVDQEIMAYRDRLAKTSENPVRAKLMSEFSTRSWADYRRYMSNLSDNAHQLDEELTFANTEVKKRDYVSRRLPYSLEEGACDAFEELIGTLYDPDERRKLEWAIGAVVAGDAKTIQKFIVLYGEGGTGKSTMLNIIQQLFEGYFTTFEAKSLTSSNNAFSTEVFRDNPLVGIQHDGDLSRIEDNTKLNSLVAHELMTMNEKYKPSYMSRANCFLFLATNKPVRITDAKSGIIRRLIDVRSSGRTIPTTKYHALMGRIEFELGSIAYRCLKVYNSMGKNYYSTYRPTGMISQTDVFFNFIDDHYLIFKEQGGVSLAQAYTMYKAYCEETNLEYRLARYKFRDELKNYFEKFDEITRIDGKQVRSYYSEIKSFKFVKDFDEPVKVEEYPSWVVLDSTVSLFDKLAASYKAQYATDKGIPKTRWANVTTSLSDLDSSQLHYVKLPINHIVIDFDIKSHNGEKSPEDNIIAASKFPPTYAEYSKSQAGLHLHYIYDGDPEELSNLFNNGIEIKVFKGDSALRRKFSKCNAIPMATISTGLPTKGEKMINFEGVKSENGLRSLIERNLRKEIHPATKPSVDFIKAILDKAYESGMKYDITDMRSKILNFAASSTNQSLPCIKIVANMKFRSEDQSENIEKYNDDRLVFFDVEVFPNLFLVSWKYQGENNEPVRMINPSPQEIESLFRMKLVGFNCRRYDNHILYACYIGYSLSEIHALSQRIINNGRSGLFGEAYNISYADVYDFATKKQSLKKWQIELGIHHQELGLPFDEPVAKNLWNKVGDYCDNDVISTELTFNSRREDFIARQILAELSGLTVNDTTQQHTSKIIFGTEKAPQKSFVYTDLSKEFPGYRFENGKSTYRGEEPGEGGYVFAVPGYYENVALLDIASMHPTSLIKLNYFGPFTNKYKELLEARLAIKRKDFEKASTYFGGALSKFLGSKEEASALAYALKIAINIVYGLTSASFDNKFRDSRNVDNIVAKRGSLFMVELKHALEERGINLVHVKTDSVKLVNPTIEDIDFVMEFGRKYGYEFELESQYKRFCLINDAVYIALDETDRWIAVGAQFAHPYVYKELFSQEGIYFSDLCETKTVTTALYLDMNEGLNEGEHNYVFIGKAGSFCPMKEGSGGGLLMRKYGDNYHFAAGTKGYRWLEAEVVKALGKEKDIDLNYFRKLVDDAIYILSQYVDFQTFRSDS